MCNLFGGFRSLFILAAHSSGPIRCVLATLPILIIIIMPRTPKVSRWYTFNVGVEILDILPDYLKSCGVHCAQYLIRSSIIEGYLYFYRTRAMPQKKTWIPRSNILMSSKDQVVALYTGVSPREFVNYGSDILFVPSILNSPVPSSLVFPKDRLGTAAVPIIVPTPPPTPIEEDIPLVFDPLDYFDPEIEIDEFNIPPYRHPSGVLIPGRWWVTLTSPDVDHGPFIASLDPVEHAAYFSFVDLLINDCTS